MRHRSASRLDRLYLSLLVAALICGGFGPVSAKQAHVHPGVALIPGPGQGPSITTGSMRLDATTGTPRAVYHTDFVATADQPEAMARQYMTARAELFGLADPALGDLTHRHTRTGRATTTVRFDQHHAGVPVLAAQVAVTLDRAGRVVFVANSYVPALDVASLDAALSATQARSVALSHLGITAALEFERTRQVIYPEAGTDRLAYEVRLVPRSGAVGDWQVVVDARSGAVLRAVDLAHYVNGNGNIFDPDPLSSAGATYGDPGFVDGNDANTPEMDAEMVDATLLDITENAGTYSLVGPYAEIVDTESPFNGLFSQSSSTWAFNRFDDAFEAALVYWHIDNYMRYINETLLIPVTPHQYSGGVRFDPSGLNGADNAHYTPSTGVVAFGEGGVDDSEDADVVIHELGHGLHDWLTNGGLSQVDGLSEGLGDYFAASYSRGLGQWGPGDPQNNWVFSWDGHNPFWSGRVTDYGATYPGGLVGQIHTDGQIWSTCLMMIWDEIGKERIDAAVIEGIAMTGSSTSQNDAANAVFNAAVAMGYTPAELSAMVTNFQATGYDVGAPAEIDVTPTELNFTLLQDTMGTQGLTIANLADATLGGELHFTIAELPAGPRGVGGGLARALATSGGWPAVMPASAPVGKNAIDHGTGGTVEAGAGGPDAFGYVWIDSDEPNGPVFDWSDITAVGTPVTLVDDGSISVALPFPFTHYGTVHNSVLISANGYLTFGSSGGVYDNTILPSSEPPNSTVAGFWDDLNPSLGGTIHHYADQANGRFVVQWTDILHYGTLSNPYTFQVILNADSSILYQYLSMSGQTNSCTIGTENGAGDTGLQVVYNANYVHDNLAVKIDVADCEWLSMSPNSGSVPAQSSVAVDATADATGLAVGTYHCDIFIANNDPDENPVVVPVELVVTSSTGVAGPALAPLAFQLVGATPNPFNPATEVRFELPSAAQVTLAIYDGAGRLVRTLVAEEVHDAGAHSARWDGRNDAGAQVASGAYFFRLNAGVYQATERAVLVR